MYMHVIYFVIPYPIHGTPTHERGNNRTVEFSNFFENQTLSFYEVCKMVKTFKSESYLLVVTYSCHLINLYHQIKM